MEVSEKKENSNKNVPITFLQISDKIIQLDFLSMAITTVEQSDLNSQIDTNNSCMANYSLDGNLYIPCILVPVENSDTTPN